MPLYTFKNRDTGEITESRMKWEERQEYLKDNPQLDAVITAPKIVSGRGDQIKVPDSHRDIVNQIKKIHPKNSINDH